MIWMFQFVTSFFSEIIETHLDLLLLLQELLHQTQKLEDRPGFSDLFGSTEEDPPGVQVNLVRPGRIQGFHIRKGKQELSEEVLPWLHNVVTL